MWSDVERNRCIAHPCVMLVYRCCVQRTVQPRVSGDVSTVQTSTWAEAVNAAPWHNADNCDVIPCPSFESDKRIVRVIRAQHVQHGRGLPGAVEQSGSERRRLHVTQRSSDCFLLPSSLLQLTSMEETRYLIIRLIIFIWSSSSP